MRNILHSAGVQHDSNPGAKGLRGQVSSELHADNPTCTMGANDLTPDDTVTAVLHLFATLLRGKHGKRNDDIKPSMVACAHSEIA